MLQINKKYLVLERTRRYEYLLRMRQLFQQRKYTLSDLFDIIYY